MPKIVYHEFEPCEKCGKKPTIYRKFADKVLCQECSDKAFKKWLKKIMAGLGSVVLIGGIFLLYV